MRVSTSMPASGTMTIAGRLSRIHWPAIALLCALAAIGVAALYAVADGAFTPWAERHSLRFLIGLGLILLIAAIPLSAWLSLSYPIYLLALVMLAAVPFVGSEAMGAKRWLSVGAFSIQPSEVMKIALVMMLARYYQWCPQDKISHPLYLIVPILAILAPIGLTLQQPDLGTATLFAVVGFGLIFLAGVSYWYFIAGGIALVGAVPFAYGMLHEYQRKRIETFLNPESDPLGSGYHIMQSKIALASGGLSGRGFLNSTQSRLDFVPEIQTDFIYSLIGEEWGFIGGLVLLSLYLLLLMMLLIMGAQCRNRFSRGLIGGITLILFVYVFVNIAMVSGMLPVVGIPLPLISYGGTAMMTFMIGFGLAMAGFAHRRLTIGSRDVPGFW